MSKKEITNIANQALVILLMITFVISAIVPDYGSPQTINIEEADLDGQESNEEKKESKEDKENINHNFRHSIVLPDGKENVLKHPLLSPDFQELYLPVITPPPDPLDSPC
ncbi:MAG: hypothetical protein ABJF11_10470 [Reichenbachiella sp.]|uniref:hypothetical protein n=1 Tax=Reichenbachiella sp. TaxID=2184521 RepID=UPI0032663B2A